MIKPVGHRVLVKPEIVEEVSKGGIILAPTARDAEQRGVMTGEVVAVGPQAWDGFSDGKPWAEVGDRVVFERYGGLAVTDEEDGLEYRIMNDEDIDAVINAKVEEA